jgi:hypothetical protein
MEKVDEFLKILEDMKKFGTTATVISEEKVVERKHRKSKTKK